MSVDSYYALIKVTLLSSETDMNLLRSLATCTEHLRTDRVLRGGRFGC